MSLEYFLLPVYCVLLSIITLAGFRVRESKIFHFVSGLLFLLCAGISFSSITPGALLPTVLLLVSAFLLIPYLMFLVGHYFDASRRIMTGVDSMTIEKSYDLAEKAERTGDLETAARIYREFLEKDLGDGDARRRLGEVLIRQGDLSEAVNCFRKVLERDIDSEPMMVLAFRTAEILAGKMGDTGSAIALLSEVRGRMKNSRFTTYVDERIAFLRAGRS